MLTEYHTHEMVTAIERLLWNALKFGTTREVESKEGGVTAEGWLVAPRKCKDIGTLQCKLNGAV